MPNLLDIYTKEDDPDYMLAARKNLLRDIINKYNINVPQSNYTSSAPIDEKYGAPQKDWSYSDGMLGYASPLLGGDLNTRVGIDKIKAHWGNKNNDVDLNMGAGGNHSIKWTGRF